MSRSENDHVVNVVWEPLPGSQTLAMSCPCNHILMEGTRGPGKDLSTSTKILTDTGWKTVGEVTYADRLVALDGSYTRILGIYPKKDRQMMDVEFFDGAVVRADVEHRWRVFSSRNGAKLGWQVKTTEELYNARGDYSVPYLEGAVGGEQWTGLDPYAVGYIIANGTTGSDYVTVYTIDDEILEYFQNTHGWTNYTYASQTARRSVAVGRTLSDPWRELLGHRRGPNKRIPEKLMLADSATRLAVLQGLMDGDGNYEKGAQCRYSTTSLALAEQVVVLVKGLGGWATIQEYHRHPEHNTFNNHHVVYGVNISHHNLFNPFRLKRKAECVQEQKKFLKRGIKSITPAGVEDGVCFAVEHESHCFVVGDYVVTHNTDAQLMYFRQFVGQGYGPYWRGVIFDREYKNLDDLVNKSKRWFHAFNDGARWLASGRDFKWVWPTGEELLFRAVKEPDDYWNYHGQEFPYIGWNELTKFPNEDLYEAMMSCNRSSFIPHRHAPLDPKTGDRVPTPEIPLVVFSTTNPYGVGHNWVKHRFIDPAPPGVPLRMTSEVFNPRTQRREEITKTQVRLFGSYKENIYLSPEYILELENITDENKRKAWLHGDWDVVAGGAIDDVWGEHNIVEDFPIPPEWFVDRAFDWGSSDPFSVGWWAIANGEEVILPSGKTFCPPAGSLIRIAEWYGSERAGSNKGLRLSASDIAKGIKRKETDMISRGILPYAPHIGPADNQIFDVPQQDVESIADKMGDHGIYWERSNKSRGTRVNGLELIRERLECSMKGEGPGLYFMRRCQASITLLPTLPRSSTNPDDVDTEAEDHCYDEIRYRVLSGVERAATSIDVRFPT